MRTSGPVRRGCRPWLSPIGDGCAGGSGANKLPNATHRRTSLRRSRRGGFLPRTPLGQPISSKGWKVCAATTAGCSPVQRPFVWSQGWPSAHLDQMSSHMYRWDAASNSRPLGARTRSAPLPPSDCCTRDHHTDCAQVPGPIQAISRQLHFDLAHSVGLFSAFTLCAILLYNRLSSFADMVVRLVTGFT